MTRVSVEVAKPRGIAVHATISRMTIAGRENSIEFACVRSHGFTGELSCVKPFDHGADPGLDGHVRRRTSNQSGGRTSCGKPSHWYMKNDVLDA